MPTIDNVLQARWLATAPPDDVMIRRFTKLGVWELTDDSGVSWTDHMYFDTATDMIFKCSDYGGPQYWSCTDPNRKGAFA